MPFGGKNCPAVWTKASESSLKPCKAVIKCVEDIVLASKSKNGKSQDESHTSAIQSFLDCWKKPNLK